MNAAPGGDLHMGKYFQPQWILVRPKWVQILTILILNRLILPSGLTSYTLLQF